MPAENAYDELHDRIDKTAISRFNAHARLGSLNTLSQWTNVIVSVTLVAIPLAQAYNLPLNAPDAVANFSQVFLAVAILALTIQFGTSNYGTRAEKHLDCGKELQALMHRLTALKGQPLQAEEYEKRVAEYEAVLAGYENHDPIDYRFTQLKKSAYYKKGCAFWWATQALYFAAFAPFVLLTITVVVFTGWLLWPIVGLCWAGSAP